MGKYIHALKIIITIQHLFSALFTNKYALMRYFNGHKCYSRQISHLESLPPSPSQSAPCQSHIFTSAFTCCTLSACLFRMCLRTNSGSLNFLPLRGHNHLSLASFTVLAVINCFTSVKNHKLRRKLAQKSFLSRN